MFSSVVDLFASGRAVYCGAMLSISFSVLAGTEDMVLRSRLNPIPVSYVFPSFASFFAVCVQFYLRALALPRLKAKFAFLTFSFIT